MNNRTKPDLGSGDNINHIKQNTTMRCYLQNPSGIMKINAETDDEIALAEIKEWDADIIGLPETNRNWKSKNVRYKWLRKVKQQLPNAKIIYAGMQHEEQNEYTQHGGVTLIINEKWAGRITESGGEKMGRWCWAKMKGQGNKTITVVVMYRPNPGSISTSQLGSVWRQQYK